jgi:helix-turn-helix, Psq domain
MKAKLNKVYRTRTSHSADMSWGWGMCTQMWGCAAWARTYSLNAKQIKSQHSAANIYIIPRTTLRRRHKGIPPKQGSRAKNGLLLKCEEEELIK